MNEAGAKAREKAEEVRAKATSPETQARIENAKEKAKDRLSEWGQRVKEKAHEAKEAAAEKTREAKRTTEEKAREAKHTAQVQAQAGKEKITEERKKDAVGKYLTVNILSPQDEMLAKRGDMVTHDLLDQAESYGMLDKVLNNTATQPTGKKITSSKNERR